MGLPFGMTKQEAPVAESQKEGPHRSEQNLDRQVLNKGILELRHQGHTGKWTVKTQCQPNGGEATEDVTHMGKTHGACEQLHMRDQASMYPNLIASAYPNLITSAKRGLVCLTQKGFQ